MKDWCIVQFSTGGTEIVPSSWINEEKLSWPPYPAWETSKVHAAIKRRVHPNATWITYEPVRLLISHDTFDDAERSLQRYLRELCDTPDLQSEEEVCHTGFKRKHRPNRLYSNTDSEDEQPPKKRFPQAPRVKVPASTTVQSPPGPPMMHRPATSSFCQSLPSTHTNTALRFYQHVESVDDSRESVRPLFKDAAFHKLITMVSELTREVRDLREEVRAYRQSSINESVDDGVLPLDLPLCNIEELNNAEAALQIPEANRAMVRRFSLIGGTTLEVRVRRILAYAITNELASVLNWAGKKNKDRTKQKRAFKETALCRGIFDGLTQQVGVNSISEFTFAQAVQKWLRYAPDRMGGAGRPTSIPTPE